MCDTCGCGEKEEKHEHKCHECGGNCVDTGDGCTCEECGAVCEKHVAPEVNGMVSDEDESEEE